LGPIPAPMQKKLGKHRAQLLLKSAQRNHLMAYLDILIDKQAELKYKSKVRWSIDVDPQEMF
jgi:primosomal protein N' (replication factor Y)